MTASTPRHRGMRPSRGSAHLVLARTATALRPPRLPLPPPPFRRTTTATDAVRARTEPHLRLRAWSYKCSSRARASSLNVAASSLPLLDAQGGPRRQPWRPLTPPPPVRSVRTLPASASQPLAHTARTCQGLHERFCLARSNAGLPPIIITAAHISTRVFGAPLQTHLRQRIAELIERVPLLSASVMDARARVPRWQLGRCAVEEVFAERQSAGPGSSTTLESLLIAEHNRWDAQRHGGPHWRVTLTTTPGSDDAYVVLAMDHLICDGRGMANLFEVLLAPTLPDLGAVSPLTAPSDEVENTRPGLLYLLPIVWSDLVLPKLLRILPEFLARRLDAGRMWPYDVTLPAPPHTLPKRLRCSRIDADSTSALRTLARSAGLRTVQPMVHLASALACYVVAQREALRLESTTPMSVRRPDRDGLVSGNFVGDVSRLRLWHQCQRLRPRVCAAVVLERRARRRNEDLGRRPQLRRAT